MARYGENHSYWHDDRLPFIEARQVRDGRAFCFGRHSHETFSIGAVTSGECDYFSAQHVERVGSGAVTIMNPEESHACNPVDRASWSYRMFYVDAEWLGKLQGENARRGGEFAAYSMRAATDLHIHSALNRLYGTLIDSSQDAFGKEVAAIDCFAAVDARLMRRAAPEFADNPGVKRAAEFICDHWRDEIAMKDLCSVARLSASYLIRAFKKRHGMTPYAWLINRRIGVARHMIRDGATVLDAAFETRFFDQAHFHKAFKRHTAVTPGEYAQSVRRSPRRDILR